MSRPSDTHSIEQTHPASDCDIAYVGYRQSGQAIVEKGSGQERLTPERESLELVNHSPSGFEWGYGGSGPAQLALSHSSSITRMTKRSPSTTTKSSKPRS